MKVYVKDIKRVDSYQEAIEEAGKILISTGSVMPEFSQACIDREVDFPTGLSLPSGKGVAIPHGNSDLVKDSAISVVRLVEDVEFGLMEDKSQKVSVKILFNLALTSGGAHINSLRKIMGLLQDDEFMNAFTSLMPEESAILLENKLAE